MSLNGWKTFRLGDLVEVNAQSISSDFAFDEIEYIDTSSVTNNKFEPPQRLKLSDAPSRAKRLVHVGDTIISTVRPIQRHFGFIKNANANTVASTGFAVLTPKTIAPEFLYYYLSQDTITNFLNAIAETTTTTFPAFRPDTLAELEIVIPDDIETQRRSAAILSALDDKIELNRQTNATLQAIAQAIFREWFVDFRFPGATGEMQESALGRIPEGWRVGKLAELVDITMGQSPPGESYNQEGKGICFFQGKAEFGFRFPTIDKFTTSPTRFANKLDTLLSVRAPVGTINMARERCCIGRGLAAIRGKNNGWSFSFYCLRNLEEHFKSYEGTGTVFGSINKAELENIETIVPPHHIIFAFEKIANQIDEMIFNLEEQSDTLAQIRDNLLPKLMRGEIQI